MCESQPSEGSIWGTNADFALEARNCGSTLTEVCFPSAFGYWATKAVTCSIDESRSSVSCTCKAWHKFPHFFSEGSKWHFHPFISLFVALEGRVRDPLYFCTVLQFPTQFPSKVHIYDVCPSNPPCKNSYWTTTCIGAKYCSITVFVNNTKLHFLVYVTRG